jgi:maleylacetoacetate isomerase
MIRLYDYRFSSAAYRVRIALNIKGASYEAVSINIAPGADEQLSEAYRLVNPQMRVPAIEVDGKLGVQSMAILEWIDETLPGPALLPSDPWTRLRVRAFADTIACDIHPLNNLSPRAYLRNELGRSEEEMRRWYAHWITVGFTALEAEANDLPRQDFLFGAVPTIAEIALVPQMANARRFNVNVSGFPRLLEIDAACRALEPFRRAAPEHQSE